MGLAFDAAGNLYIANGDGAIYVLPTTSGTLFGQSVSADTVTTIAAGLGEPTDLAFDPAGNLYIANYEGTISVLPETSGTLFGQSVSADTVAAVATGLSVPFAVGVRPRGQPLQRRLR